MKLLITVLVIATCSNLSSGQNVGDTANVKNQHYRLVKGSEGSNSFRVELSSNVDTTWAKWQHRGYNFGFNPKSTPIYTTVNGILSTPYMVQVRGNENEQNRKRWGFHVFEGYAKDD